MDLNRKYHSIHNIYNNNINKRKDRGEANNLYITIDGIKGHEVKRENAVCVVSYFKPVHSTF